MTSKITLDLMNLLQQRDAAGLKKYGVTLDRKDLTVEEWLQHATEELLDAAGYMQTALRELHSLRNPKDADLRVVPIGCGYYKVFLNDIHINNIVSVESISKLNSLRHVSITFIPSSVLGLGPNERLSSA
jgi:hypothetical protein